MRALGRHGWRPVYAACSPDQGSASLCRYDAATWHGTRILPIPQDPEARSLELKEERRELDVAKQKALEEWSALW